MQDLKSWRDRWEAGQTGWHRDDVHPWLVSHPPQGDRVLVPLCGATLAIDWLLEQGYRVVGVETSLTAVSKVFSRLGLNPEAQELGNFTVFQANGLTIASGDFFELQPEHIDGTCDAIWDRAALVAVPPESRSRYFDTLRRLAPDADLRCVVFEYPDEAMSGPPHSIQPQEMKTLATSIELVARDDVSDEFNARTGGNWSFKRSLYRGIP